MWGRCVQDADGAAAAAMRATEGAVKAEMEAKSVYEQVKLAVSAAQASREYLLEEEEAEAAEAEAAAAEAKVSETESTGVKVRFWRLAPLVVVHAHASRRLSALPIPPHETQHKLILSTLACRKGSWTRMPWRHNGVTCFTWPVAVCPCWRPGGGRANHECDCRRRQHCSVNGVSARVAAAACCEGHSADKVV